MSLFMETTEISPETSIGQIQKVLSKYGTSAILTEYKDGQVVALSFRKNVNGVEIPFRLPARHNAIYELLINRRKNFIYKDSVRKGFEDKARRVAWRQILRWVEAQLALVETNMVSVEEVFMSYIQTGPNQTLFDRIKESKFQIGYEKGTS